MRIKQFNKILAQERDKEIQKVILRQFNLMIINVLFKHYGNAGKVIKNVQEIIIL